MAKKKIKRADILERLTKKYEKIYIYLNHAVIYDYRSKSTTDRYVLNVNFGVAKSGQMVWASAAGDSWSVVYREFKKNIKEFKHIKRAAKKCLREK